MTREGKPDAVDTLYAEYASDEIQEGANPLDPYGIWTANFKTKLPKTHTKPIRLLVPEGFRTGLSMTTKTSARLCLWWQYNVCRRFYRARVTAMLTKLPGFIFTSYQWVELVSEQVITNTDYKQLLIDFFKYNPETRPKYKKMIDSYNFTDDLPKY